MANEEEKEKIYLTSELLAATEAHTAALEKSYGITLKSQTATKNQLSLARDIAKMAFEESLFQEESSYSLRSKESLLAAEAKTNQIALKIDHERASLGNKNTKVAKNRLASLNQMRITNQKVGQSIEKLYQSIYTTNVKRRQYHLFQFSEF